MRLAVTLVVLLLLAYAVPCLGWGGEGHQAVALIAEERLTERAQARVKELLGGTHLSDAEVVNWADEIRRERRKTAPWHYVNIPIDAEGYDAKRDGKDGQNVIDAITRFQ